MNVFGINIQRSKTLASAMAALAAPAADDSTELESVKFGRQYTKGTSKEMLDVLEHNRLAAERNTKIALYLSIPHQALYLLSKVELKHTTPIEWAETGLAILLALAIPYLVDQLILMCIRILAARAASTGSKWRAAATLAGALPASMYVNFAAPGAFVLRLAAAGLIVLVALYQIVRTVRPNFTKVGETERELTAEVDSIAGVTTAAVVKPSKSQSSATIRRNGERALALATANPKMTVTELVRASGVGSQRARRILDEVNLLNVPTSPLVGPVGAYAGPKA